MHRITYVLTFLLSVLTIQLVESQEELPKFDKITLVDGTVVEGRVTYGFPVGKQYWGERGKTYVFNKKIKICKDEKGKNCEKYEIEDVESMVIAPSPLMFSQIEKLEKKNRDHDYDLRDFIYSYKVLLSPEKELPRIALLEYKGENADFYIFNKSSKNDKFYHGEYFITKPDSNIIEYHFPALGAKKDIQKLNEYFKDCPTFTSITTKKKAYKDKETMYFFELTDKCE